MTSRATGVPPRARAACYRHQTLPRWSRRGGTSYGTGGGKPGRDQGGAGRAKLHRGSACWPPWTACTPRGAWTGRASPLTDPLPKGCGCGSRLTTRRCRSRGTCRDRGGTGPVAPEHDRDVPGFEMADPPPSMTCTLERDHRVGTASGCPACLRLTAPCAARPCSAARPGQAWRGTRVRYRAAKPGVRSGLAPPGQPGAARTRGARRGSGRRDRVPGPPGLRRRPRARCCSRPTGTSARVITGATGNAAPGQGPA